MSCEYSKYIDSLLDGSLSEKKKDELNRHSLQCAECYQRINKIDKIDSLIKETLTVYPFSSSKSEIMEKVNTKKRKAQFLEGFFHYRKPVYVLTSILIIALAFTYFRPAINKIIPTYLSAAAEKADTDGLNFPISSANIKGITMPGENYSEGGEIVIHLPYTSSTDPESEARVNKIVEGYAKQEAAYIEGWVNYINSHTQLRESTKSEIDAIGYKSETPLTLCLNGGGYIHLYPVIEKTEVSDTIQGRLTVKIPYMDRYIIGYESKKGGSSNIKYYTVFSKTPLILQIKEIKEKIYKSCTLNKIDSDGNISKDFAERGTDLLKEGDKMVISGFSTKDDVFDVYITTRESKNAEKYKIAHIADIEGEWSLEKTFSSSMNTSDGNKFNLGNKEYYYSIEFNIINGKSGFSGRLADLR